MYVITVIPIARGIGKENLSYFSTNSPLLGSLVEVPLRKKFIDALVIKVIDARSIKTEIRRADFSLRKVEKLVSKPFLPEAFMKMVEDMARFHAATVGATLKVLLPKRVVDSFFSNAAPTLSQFPIFKSAQILGNKEESGAEKEKKLSSLTASFTERIERYKEEIAKQPMAVIVTPTKERQDTFKKIFAVPIILPSSLIEIPQNTSLIILEDADSQAYKGISRPFIDFRMAIERYAQYLGASVLKGKGGLDEAVTKVIEEHKKEEGITFSSIGKELEKDIKKMRGGLRAGHFFILATRKGHSGTVLCQDCGHIFRCTRCDAPLTLHLKSVEEDFNTMLCHHCGYKTTAHAGCPICASWRLKAYGLGIEKIEDDITALCKKHKIKAYIQRIDSTLKLTPKKIKDFLKTHYEKPCSIIIGTELLLPYMVNISLEGKKNDASYIASLDTLLSLPDFCINQKIWKLCTMLDDTTKKKVVIQTRNLSHPLLETWSLNDEKCFSERELEECRQFNYPPHGVFIKITMKGKKEIISKEMRKVETLTKEWKPMVFPAFIKTIKNQHILHALLVIPKNEWVNEELLEILRNLPLSVTVEVNPRSLL